MSGEDIGVVAFSFALRPKKYEPNPCNIRLAEETLRIARKYQPRYVVTQWEITAYFTRCGLKVDASVGLNADGSYLNSQGVWDAAKEAFNQNGVWRVVPVVQPFLQRFLVKRMIARDGFEVIREPIKRIGFDNHALNTQWWTKSAPALVWYSVLSVVKAVLAKVGIRSRVRAQF